MSGDYEKLVEDWLREFDQLKEEIAADEHAAFLRSEAGGLLLAGALLLYALPKDSETERLWEKIEQGNEAHAAVDQLLQIAANRVNLLLAKESLTIREASIVATFKRRKVTTQDWIRRQISNEKLTVDTGEATP